MKTMPDSFESDFVALAAHCDISTLLCDAAGHGLLNASLDIGQICTRIHLPQSRAADVEKVLEISRDCGLFEKNSPLSWRCRNQDRTSSLAPLLRGALLYQQKVHQDRDVVDVVLTKPPKPSQLVHQLEQTLLGSAGFRDTRELLPSIAEAAIQNLTVMTPFLDGTGAGIVMNLFERTTAPHKWLIVRPTKDGSPQPGLVDIEHSLRKLGVTVLNFHIGRTEGIGNETFHAKVVLADDSAAYIGSSNMTEWSFNYSLEMGVFVRGKAAGRIAHLMDAVIKASRSF